MLAQEKVNDMTQADSRKPVFTQPLSVIRSRQLFEGAREIGIDHEGALYRLRITRQGKLILNK